MFVAACECDCLNPCASCIAQRFLPSAGWMYWICALYHFGGASLCLCCPFHLPMAWAAMSIGLCITHHSLILSFILPSFIFHSLVNHSLVHLSFIHSFIPWMTLVYLRNTLPVMFWQPSFPSMCTQHTGLMSFIRYLVVISSRPACCNIESVVVCLNG